MIPCKRPKVTTEPDANVAGLWDHVCHVPGCGWSFISVKSASEPKWHRQDHMRAVPVIEATDLGVYIRVNCACGHEHRVHGTKRDVASHVEYHLTHDHGLVSC